MRLGFDVTPLCNPPTGVGMYTAQLYTHLARVWKGEVRALAHRPQVWHNGASARVPVDVAPRWPLNKTVWMQVILPWQLSRERIALAHFTNSVAPLYTPCPFVVTVHDMSLWLYPQFHYSRRLIAMRPLIPLAVRRARAVITVSHSARQDILRILNLPPERVHVIHEAPAPWFRPLPPGPWAERVRQRYGLPEPYILYVGTIEPRKNLVRLLHAFYRLRKEHGIPHHLILVGQRGWKDEAIFLTITQLGLEQDVRYLGYVPRDDLVALYNLADVFVFPSLYEGFGLPVVEAMACGTPVVTSHRGALAEITHDAAEHVDPTSVASIAAGIARVLLDTARAQELRARGQDRARLFDWEKTARQTAALYQHLL